MNGQINLGDIKPLRYFLTIAIVVGLMFAFIAPDDDLKFGWLGHILHWQVQTLLPMLLAIAVLLFLSSINLLNLLNPWIKLFASGLIACFIVTPVALLSDLTLTGQELERTFTIALLMEFFAISPPILVCWVAINSPFQLGFQLKRSIDSEDQAPAVEDFSFPFFELLPPEIRSEPIYLKSELHYLQVVTTKGTSLILYSLKKAIEELMEIEGVQPHRSFWVNKAFIKEIVKKGREGQIIVSNGDVIPISRSNLENMRSTLTR